MVGAARPSGRPGLFWDSFSRRARPPRSVLTAANPGLSLGPNPGSLSRHTRPLTAQVRRPPLRWEAPFSSVSVVTSLPELLSLASEAHGPSHPLVPPV